MKNMSLVVLAVGLGAVMAAPGAFAQDVELEEQARETRADRARQAERFCIQDTGSRIVAQRNARSRAEREQCVAQGGRVYTRQEIEQTGSVDMADALRRLDPSIR